MISEMKETDLGLLPESWDLQILGDLLYIKGRIGWKGLKKSEYLEEGYAIINGEQIINDKVNWNSVGRISKERFLESPEIILKRKDILMTKDGTIGKIAYVDHLPEDATVASGVFVIRNDSKLLHTKYLYNFFKSRYFKWLIKGRTEGSVIPHLYQRDFKEMMIPLPSFEEQKAITKILTAFDDKIELLQAQNKTLETILKVKHEDLFTVCSSLDCPKVKVGDYVKTNSISINKNYNHNSILYMDTGSLTNGVTESLQEIKLSEAPSRAKRLVKHNDILISTVRPNQKHFGIIKYPINNLVVSTGFCVISCEKIDPHFLYYVLTSNDMTDYLHSIAEGSTSTYPSIKPIDLESVEFVLPPNDRIEKFSKTASIFWDKIHLNQIQVKSLTKTRDTLLPKLMSGQVRVKNLKQTADA